jgi:triosephosphate isomerase
MHKSFFLLGNWKANGSLQQVRDFCSEVTSLEVPIGITPILAPPFPYLDTMKLLLPQGYGLAAQTCQSSSFTGQITAPMLKDVGCGWVLIGHGERQESFQEVRQQILAVQGEGMIPIVCVGEKDPDSVLDVLDHQCGHYFQDISGGYWVAYEPIWAIGSGKTPDGKHLKKVSEYLKQKLHLPLLYGGSVNSTTVFSLLSSQLWAGFLVGKASLKACDWMDLIQQIKDCVLLK